MYTNKNLVTHQASADHSYGSIKAVLVINVGNGNLSDS